MPNEAPPRCSSDVRAIRWPKSSSCLENRNNQKLIYVQAVGATSGTDHTNRMYSHHYLAPPSPSLYEVRTTYHHTMALLRAGRNNHGSSVRENHPAETGPTLDELLAENTSPEGGLMLPRRRTTFASVPYRWCSQGDSLAIVKDKTTRVDTPYCAQQVAPAPDATQPSPHDRRKTQDPFSSLTALSSPSAFVSPGYSPPGYSPPSYRPPSPSLHTWFRERTQEYVRPASAFNGLLFDMSDTPPSPGHHMPHLCETLPINKGRHAIGPNDSPWQKTRDLLGNINRRPFNPDCWMVIKSHQQKRLADQADQSWAACLIQEQEASRQCEPLRTLW